VALAIASTSSEQNAYPDWDDVDGLHDYNAEDDRWIEFTSDFLLSMEFYTSDEFWHVVTDLDSPVFANDTLKLFWLCYYHTQINCMVLSQRTGNQTPCVFYP
jgi:hypothetical protein